MAENKNINEFIQNLLNNNKNTKTLDDNKSDSLVDVQICRGKATIITNDETEKEM